MASRYGRSTTGLVRETCQSHESEWAAIVSVAEKILRREQSESGAALWSRAALWPDSTETVSGISGAIHNFRPSLLGAQLVIDTRSA